MTTAALPLGAPACPDCRGGGDVNGVPCRGCAGRGRARPVPRVPASLRALARRWSMAAAEPAGRLVGTLVRWSATVPGVAGAAGVTIGAAMVVHGVFRQVPELGLVAAVGGVFLLALDRRL